MTSKDSYTNTSCPCCLGEDVEQFCEANGYNILKCSHCGFGFVENIPSEQELADQYASRYVKNDMFQPKASLTRKVRYWLLGRYIQRLLRNRERIDVLEIGCAQADLMQALRRNDKVNAVGIDYAKGPIEHAKALGLNVHQSSLRDMHFPAASFDCVAAYHVIEHVYNVEQTFCEIKRVLNSGGYFIGVVPCFSHIKARFHGKNWKYIEPPAHLWYFSRMSFEILLHRHDFEIVSSSCLYRKAHMRIVARA